MIRVAANLSRHLSALAEARTDGELIAAFLATHDELAFAELVRRHGPLVWNVCRRLLPGQTDAEDAFQATFLVLVQRARRLTGAATVGPWLHKVATWTARNVRRRNARELARRRPLLDAPTDAASTAPVADLRADLDAALLALPEKYRAALVLCHLQGWSRRDAAAKLGCPEGTLSSLLSRGLAQLRAQLRSHDPAKLLTITGAAAPVMLANATARAAVASLSQAAAGVVISSSVSQLAEGVLHMLWVKKATAATFALVVVFGLGVGAGVSVREVPGAMAGDGPPTGQKDVPGGPAGKPAAGQTVTAAGLSDVRKKLEAELAELEAALKTLESEVAMARERSAWLDRMVRANYLTAAQRDAESAKHLQATQLLAEKRALRDKALRELEALGPGRAGPPTSAQPESSPVSRQNLHTQLEGAKAMQRASRNVQAAAKEGIKLSEEKLALCEKAGDQQAIARARLDLARFRLNLADAEKRIAEAEVQIQELEAKLKAAPPEQVIPLLKSADDQLAIAALDKMIRDARDARDQAEKVYRRLIATEAAGKTETVAPRAIQDAQVALNKAEEDLLQLEERRASLQAASLKAPPTTASSDLDQELRDLRRRAEAAEAGALALRANAEANALKIAELEAQQRQLAAKISELTARRVAAPAATSPAHLVVIIYGNEAAWASGLQEFGPTGASLGHATFSQTELLKRVLTRTAKDPTAPKELHITIRAGAPSARIRHILEVCQEAGYPTAALTGRVGLNSEPEGRDFTGQTVRLTHLLKDLK